MHAADPLIDADRGFGVASCNFTFGVLLLVCEREDGVEGTTAAAAALVLLLLRGVAATTTAASLVLLLLMGVEATAACLFVTPVEGPGRRADCGGAFLARLAAGSEHAPAELEREWEDPDESDPDVESWLPSSSKGAAGLGFRDGMLACK